MAAIDAVLQIIADQEIMPSFSDERDPLNDLALFDRMSGNNNVTDFDPCFAIDQDNLAVFQRRVH